MFRPDVFHQLAQQAQLQLGTPCHHTLVTGSTNDDARQSARAGAPHGSLFVADQQRSGRGRRGRSWTSAAGDGLLFSLVLRPALALEQLTPLPLVVGLAVVDGLATHTSAPLRIKWPNDVLCEGRKLAGVLVEAELDPSAPGSDVPSAVITGVGINLESASLPKELQATSVRELVITPPARESLLVDTLRSLEHWLEVFRRDGTRALASRLNELDALRERSLRVGPCEGRGAGIDPLGQLRIATKSGVVAVRSGTVELL